jgi:hypothetical protein
MEACHIEMAVEILKIVTFGTSHHIVLPGLRFYIFILRPCPEHISTFCRKSMHIITCTKSAKFTCEHYMLL